MTLGVKPRGRDRRGDRFGQLDHLDGAGAVGQPADEAALLERGDQAVNSRLGAQIERILHLVERGRHARLGQALVDEAQEFELLASQHRRRSPECMLVTKNRHRNKA